MSKEKQIEEISMILCGMKNGCDGCMFSKVHCNERNYAEEIYNAGYRKSEWISVEERLPERNGRYLTHWDIENQSLVCVLYYCKIGGFNEGTVTHWMPLPEPPKSDAKMKGGAE